MLTEKLNRSYIQYIIFNFTRGLPYAVQLEDICPTVAVLGFSFWGPLGWQHFHLGGGHTTNTFALNYRVCNHLYQIINTSKFIS